MYVFILLIVVLLGVFIYRIYCQKNDDDDNDNSTKDDDDTKDDRDDVTEAKNRARRLKNIESTTIFELFKGRQGESITRTKPASAVVTKGTLLSRNKFRVGGDKGVVWTLSPGVPESLVGSTVIINGYTTQDLQYFIVNYVYSGETPHNMLYSSQESLIE
jgi:hypothetical protein